jgi:hypothetical protein
VYKWYDPRGPLRPRELGAEMADALLAGAGTFSTDRSDSHEQAGER